MDKILDKEFRNALYNNLVDAGYDKKEAQKIVGVKYHASLKADLMNNLKVLVDSIESEKYDCSLDEEFAKKISDSIAELKKVKGVIE
jgi:hypothetical protein